MPTGYTVDEEKKQRVIDAHVKHKVAVSELAKAYNVNRKTIYKWLKEADTSKPENEQPSGDEAPDQEEPAKTETAGESEADDQEEHAEEDKPETDLRDCPNPSCKAKYDGEECSTCGFRSDRIISLFSQG